MATFKSVIYKHQKRNDGTWNVKIRVTHKREAKYIPTSIFVTTNDVTRSLNIKNKIIELEIDSIIFEYRSICNRLGTSIDNLTPDELIEILKRGDKEESNDIDFIAFSLNHIETIESKGTASNYRIALNSFMRFSKRKKILFSEITYNLLTSYAKYLIKQKEKRNKEAIKKGERVTTNRALSLYTACLRHLYNEGKLFYNDEDRNRLPIPWSPFSKFKIPSEEPTRKRALTPEQIRAIFELPDKEIKNKRKTITENCRRNIARDIFILSFCLIGMNSADLYLCDDIDGKTIKYYRAKTKSRKKDRAELHVDIQKIIEPIVEKYRDRVGNRVFNFCYMYRDTQTFNAALNKGLKEIGDILQIEDLEFYAARHSWATIATNNLRIDKYVVHEALNHASDEMRITDIYIKKDFSGINDANKQVLEYVFGEDAKNLHS